MKKFYIFFLMVMMLSCTIWAQNRERSQDRKPPVSVKIEGTLELKNGHVALASGDTVYLVPMLTRYIGFLEGLKEGNKISVEGYQSKNIIHPVTVSINGKSYDFTPGRQKTDSKDNNLKNNDLRKRPNQTDKDRTNRDKKPKPRFENSKKPRKISAPVKIPEGRK